MTTNADIAILIVDDEEYMRRIVKRILKPQGYSCVEASNAGEALDALTKQQFALVISDITMPGTSGLDLLEATRELVPGQAFLMLTGIDSPEIALRTLELGAQGYLVKPFQPAALLISVANALYRNDFAKLRTEYEHRLERDVLERTMDIRKREMEITLHLVAASEYRSEETGSHVRRMSLYAAALAMALGWKTEDVELLRLAATMHDIGKIGIPDHILLKKGPFTREEFDIMKEHTVIGAGILSGSEAPLIQMSGEVALCHHEWWNGAGYPRGLSGDAIPEGARIVAVADVYDALTTDRVYREAFPEREAFEMMIADKGIHFDPRIIACMRDIHKEFKAIRKGTNHP